MRWAFPYRAALSPEVLFLRKQLAFYQEHQISPRRLNAAALFVGVVVSILQLERGIDDCQAGDSNRLLASQGI